MVKKVYGEKCERNSCGISGAAYIPIDLNYDTERVKNIIQSSNR